jgi:hypothetical protein
MPRLAWPVSDSRSLEYKLPIDLHENACEPDVKALALVAQLDVKHTATLPEGPGHNAPPAVSVPIRDTRESRRPVHRGSCRRPRRGRRVDRSEPARPLSHSAPRTGAIGQRGLARRVRPGQHDESAQLHLGPLDRFEVSNYPTRRHHHVSRAGPGSRRRRHCRRNRNESFTASREDASDWSGGMLRTAGSRAAARVWLF